jgi:transposase-like protein
MPTEKEKDMSLMVSEEEETENPLADMPPKMQRFLHLYMTGQYSINKLAQLLELHPNTLHKWMKRSDVKDAIADMQEATHEVVSNQMKSMTLKAMERMRELMDSPIDGVALQAVKDVLDRTGHKPKQEIKKEINVRTFEEKLNDLINDSIDADYEEIEE